MKFSFYFKKEKMANVYDIIHKRFDVSRYSIWKSVKDWIQDEKNNIEFLLEVGCGNGKNMLYALKYVKNVFGIDNSKEMVRICKEKGLDVQQMDILRSNSNYGDIIYSDNKFLFPPFSHIMCIAVIHHFETEDDRIIAIKNICSYCTHKILISVWADTDVRAKTGKDQMVRFVYKENESVMRYYHFFDENEMLEIIEKANVNFSVEKIWNEFNNIFVILTRK